MRNHSFIIIKLMVAIILMVGLFSCGKYSAVAHAKKHGLVTHGCRGIDAKPKSHFMK